MKYSGANGGISIGSTHRTRGAHIKGEEATDKSQLSSLSSSKTEIRTEVAFSGSLLLWVWDFIATGKRYIPNNA